LEFALLSKVTQDASDNFQTGFEMVADVEEGYVRLVFRQRVGELTVDHSPVIAISYAYLTTGSQERTRIDFSPAKRRAGN